MFTCSKVIRGPTRFGKALNLIFPKLSSQNMRGFDQATILSPSFHGLSKNAWHNDPPFVYKIRRKTLGSTWKIGWGYYEKLGGGVRHPSWNPYPISEQKLWFSLPYFKPEALEPCAWPERVTSCYGTYKVGVNIKRVMVLSPNDELLLKNIPDSHALFETKTAQNPYPLAPHIPI